MKVCGQNLTTIKPFIYQSSNEYNTVVNPFLKDFIHVIKQNKSNRICNYRS